MSCVFRLILSNGLAFVCFLLVVFSSVHIKKDSMLRINLAMMLLTFAAYVIIGCFGAAAATGWRICRR